MPRIDAPTVVEHRARQRQSLIAAARSLLARTGEAPSMAAVGREAGLARSSVYEYFDSSDALMAAVVAEVFPDWARQIDDRVAAASTPGERVWAYIEANVDLMTTSELAVARALAKVVDDEVLEAPMREFHERLQVPLRLALAELGEPDPAAAAGMIDALVMSACRVTADHAALSERQGDRARALALIGRMLSPYLHVRDAPRGGRR